MDMNWQSWFTIEWQQLAGIALSAVGLYIILILFTRLMGLRSFSKLSSYDFAMTVAMGSILASTVLSKSPSLLQGTVAIGILFLIQGFISVIRRRFKSVKALIDNQAIIVMAQGQYIEDNLQKAHLSHSDVQEVLRKNGIKSKKQVFAVIMETTGDMSVIKNDDNEADWSLFDNIRDSKLLIESSNK